MSRSTGCHLSLARRKEILLLKFNNKYCEIFKGYCQGFSKGALRVTKKPMRGVGWARGGLNHSSQCQHPQLWAINYNFRMLSFYFFLHFWTPLRTAPHTCLARMRPLAIGSPGHSTFLWCLWAKKKEKKQNILCCMAARCAPISGVSGHAWVGCFHMYLKCLVSEFFHS